MGKSQQHKISLEDVEVNSLRKKVRKIPQLCYTPGCRNKSIRSHIQQKNGPLREIAENGKIVQLDLADNGQYRFITHGIGGGDVLTFWGFCNSCDTKLFKSIETNEVDYSLYRNQLLYSYRGLVNEIYKQDYNLKWYELIFVSSRISNSRKLLFRQKKTHFTYSISELKSIKAEFEREIKRTNSLNYFLFRFLFRRQFQFAYFKMPRIDICTAACCAMRYGHNKEFSAHTYLNLMPREDDLHVIIGHYNTGSQFKLNVKSIKEMQNEQKLKVISDIIIVRLETWCISTQLFEQWVLSKKNSQILNHIHYYFDHVRKFEVLNNPATLTFNMFS